MKKIIKVIIFALVVFSVFFINSMSASAKSSIKDIDMDVYIDDNGNATVTESWKVDITKGTEGYKEYTFLEDSKIYDFTVTDETGRKYETLSKWDSEKNFKDKAYKCGIKSVSNGVELCWGISEYGEKTYTLKYKISNFVIGYEDAKVIKFNFIKLDEKVKNAKVTIHAIKDFTEDNAEVWNFGSSGTIKIQEGNIVLDSKGELSKSSYMEGLIKINSQDMFKTKINVEKSFKELYDSMKEGQEGGWAFIFIFVIGILPCILIPLLIKYRKKHPVVSAENLYFGKAKLTLPKDKDLKCYRDIPCNKSLERAYWIAYQYNITSENNLEKGIIGAILLKWLREDKVRLIKGSSDKEYDEYLLDLSNIEEGDSLMENGLLKIFKSAAGKKMLLSEEKFISWASTRESRFVRWTDNIIKDETKELQKEGLIVKETIEKKRLFRKNKIIKVKSVQPSIRDEAIHLAGFKKFLKDFEKNYENKYVDTSTLEEYLIFAQLLGLGKKFGKEIDKFYPNFREASILSDPMKIFWVCNVSDVTFSSGGFSGADFGGSSGGGFR